MASTADELIINRIKFKFYAAEKHLSHLKDLEANGETIAKNESRVKYEIEMEDLLSHLIGALDALLVRINDKLGLGIPLKDVKFGTVSEKLDSISRQDVLQQWAKLRDPLIYPKGSWLTFLTEIRNVGTHRTIVNKRIAVSLHEDVNTGKGTNAPNRTYFGADPDSTLEMMPYLEDRIQKVKVLVDSTMQKETSLKGP